MKQQSRDQERNTETGRVDGEEPDAVPGLAGTGGNHQDRGEDRADARCPAGGKSQSDHKGADKAARLAVQVDTPLTKQEADGEEAGQVQSYNFV